MPKIRLECYYFANKIILMSQSHKNIQLIKILKSCIEQTLLLYKTCQAVPKPLDNAKDVGQYSQNLLKLIRNIVDFVPKNMVALQNYNKLKYEHDKLNNEFIKATKEIKQYKCELDVVSIRLGELEAKDMKAQEEKAKQKRYSIEFQNKLEKIRKDSEQGLKKIIQTSRSQEIKSSEKKASLPSIHTYASREKLGMLLLMSQPLHKPPKRKMAESFKKI